MSPDPLPDEAVRTALEATRGPVSFEDFRAILDRDAVFVVAPTLSILDCAVAIALDRIEDVRRWVEAGTLRKPSRDERASWPLDPERQWTSIVVQPFVLVQDLPG